ncbi:MAG: ATP-binding protein [bacterium]
MAKMDDIIKSQSKEIDPIVNELSLMKQLIKERAHPLDLLRELISNSGAKGVGATEIKIKYTVDEEGHIFEVIDDGCGMDFTDNKLLPGRLDKFFGLGLSTIVGIKADEFSWKGLGSKLAYQSRRIEIDTWCGTGDAIKVEINEPWSSIERKLIPKPKVFTYKPEEGRTTGTSIKVFGHPPHRKERPFTGEEIKKFLQHRTFVGFTKEREKPPKVILSVLGNTETIDFGFPELKFKEDERGTVFVDEYQSVTKSGTNKSISVYMKGSYTWDEKDYGLDKNQLNTGLILSVKGIPYFNLDMEEYGSRNLKTARPGENKCCLIVECDQIQEEMNISRNGLVDSGDVDLFKSAVTKIFERIESSDEYLKFRRVQEDRKAVASAEDLGIKKQELESETQKWVVYQPSESEKPILLLREPEYETDVLCLLWKLEVLNILPFKKFQTLGYVGSGKKGGPDLIVHFQEDEQSDQERYAPMEVENKFYNYIPHGHKPSQFPKVICWEIGKTPKIAINKTDKKYKFTAVKDDFQIHIFSLRLMDKVKILTKKELNKYGVF